MLFCVAVFLAYHFIIEPTTRRWLGYFGDSRIPQGFTIRGIDVSHHQGPIDWEKLARATIGGERLSFAFIKATEGTTLIDSLATISAAPTARASYAVPTTISAPRCRPSRRPATLSAPCR